MEVMVTYVMFRLIKAIFNAFEDADKAFVLCLFFSFDNIHASQL
jgi:hypothetical protein